ncbi:molecular chaperone DjiA [Mesonia sp. K7]|uniref:molecular chaperone DjiA n=1 Tax=Mesonia sp. K7 TaxID=2218606 RepID=UPI000DA74555|nr:molecular chaperone DjiA [Mesonia sp. K7]PZD77451.1 molecular chaperone DjiA [Mesonia sp. K7]
MLKWIFAILGFTYYRFFGGIIGFIIGMIIENYFLKSQKTQGGIFGDVFSGNTQSSAKVTPQDFELNLLTLCSVIIKADGSINQRELDYVRAYFVQAYGKERANATFRTFNDVIKKREIDSARICAYMRMRTSYEVRLQILHFLFGITQADGSLSSAEEQELNKIARHLHISQRDYISIKAMFAKTNDTGNAYKILEIERNATDAEVKKAFRTMAKKYHPDKLQGMDEVYKKGAQEKFLKVQEAYEQIQKERGF